jgi:hypothetical protein
MFLDIIHRLVFIKKIVLFFPQNNTFRKLGSVFVLGENLLCWAQSIELIPISGDLKVSGDGKSIWLLCSWTLSIVLYLSKNRPVFFKTLRFGNWVLSPSSGKT